MCITLGFVRYAETDVGGSNALATALQVAVRARAGVCVA
jgi:hypothetical protein